MRKLLKQVAAWFVLYILPGGFTLGAGGWLSSHLARWYDVNGYHRFKKGDVLELRCRNIVGYGIRPRGTVLGFKWRELIPGRREESYVIEMEKDATGDFFEWMKTGLVPDGTERVTEVETHFKWNIEHQFRRIPGLTREQATQIIASPV